MAHSRPLAEEAALYRALFEDGDDPILVADGAGRYVDANNAALALLGYTRNELLQLQVRDVSLREPTERATEFTRLKEDGQWRGESRLRRKDGSVVWTETRAVQVALPEGARYLGIFRDQTERLQAEAALRESEDRYRTLLNVIDEGFALCQIILDEQDKPVDYRHLQVNPAWERLTGYTAEQGLAKTARELVPDLEERWIQTYGRVALQREAIRFEAHVAALNRWFSIFATPIGEPSEGLFAVIFTDNSEYIRAEAALRQSESRSRALLDQLPVGIGLTDAEGRWVLANAVLRHFAADIIPSRDPQVLARWRTWDKDGHPVAPADWPGERALRGEIVPGLDFLYTAADGTERWTRVGSAPFRPATEEIAGAIIVLQDIDAQQRADDALRRSEERYRTLVHATATAVWRMSGDGQHLLEVQGGSTMPYDLAQGPNDAWLGLYIHPEDQQVTLASWRQAVEAGRIYDHITRVRSVDGTYRWVRARGVPVRDEQGTVREWIGTSTDITEHKQLEQLREDVLAMVSHDLRAPLAVISMRAQLLQRRGSFDGETISLIIEQAQRMARLIDDLAETVRLEAGQLVLQPEAVDLGLLVSQAVVRAQALTIQHQLRIERPEMPVIGSWDRARIEEVLDNLLGNAIKYSPTGGAVVVVVVAIAGGARLSVTDHGVGIPEAALPRLFERFHRADAVGAPGLGLGLYIARMLVEAHGGRIEAASTLGEGSTFTVELPLNHTS